MMLYDQGAYSKIAKTQRYVFMSGEWAAFSSVFQ
jgi:hypothetical protein